MNDFLYRIPHWAMGVYVVGVTTAVSGALYAMVHRFLRPKLTAEEAAAGPAFAGILATVTSLLLAFTAVSVWEAFKSADGAATNEATAATMLARDIASLDGKPANAAREELRGYLNSVVEKEWPVLEKGETSQDSRLRLDHIFRAVALIEPKTKRDEIITAEVWGRLNELARYRRERIMSSRARVPQTLWAVVIIGTLLTVVCAGTIKPNAFGWAMVLSVGVSFGLVFFFILAMDRPFSGLERVGPDAIQETLNNMEFWDTTPKRR